MVHQRILTAFLALSSALVITHAQTTNRPWFCQDYACPSFTSRTVGTRPDNYEIRNYAESVWATTSVTSSDPDVSRSQRSSMFRKLFKYISGENASGTKIDMTVPVLTKIEDLGNRSYRVSMMFYLAIPNPPAPTANSVVLVTRPAGNVFVKSFPSWWWPASSIYRQKVNELKTLIGRNGQYNDNVYFKTGYNSPWDYLTRKQFEVWIDSTDTLLL